MKGRDKRLKEIADANLGEQSKAAERVIKKREIRRRKKSLLYKFLFRGLLD